MVSLILLEQNFTIHRMKPGTEIPPAALNSPFFSLTRTGDELSLVLPEYVEIGSENKESGWACFKVEGPLAFSLVGVLSGIAGALARAGVPIFALSTFDTDYILLKREHVGAAREALTAAGYQVR